MSVPPDPAPFPAAHVNVIRGDTAQRCAFFAGTPALMVVGSAPDAQLCIVRPDVAPRQLDVVWDGAALWVQDALRLGRTFVNGRTLNEWVAIDHHAIVSFASVRLWVMGPPVPEHTRTPDFAALERARLSQGPESAIRRHETGRITIPPELLEQLNEANGRSAR